MRSGARCKTKEAVMACQAHRSSLMVIAAISFATLLASGCASLAPIQQGPSIQLDAGAKNAEPADAKVYNVPNENHVRWSNNTKAQITLAFTSTWPFTGSNTPIVIAPHTISPWYTVD